MKLSVVVITANPTEKQYAWREALASYCDLADEVIVVDGGTEDLDIGNDKLKVIKNPDPEVWTWSEHAKKLNIGFKEATGDWILKADIDWVFHEDYFEEIRNKLSALGTPVATFQKFNYYPFKKYREKGEIPIAVNKDFKDRIRFGKDPDKYTDLTYPIWSNDVLLDKEGVPVGTLVKEYEFGRTGQPFWNFDYTFKTIDRAKKSFLRMSLSHEDYFGTTKWGHTEEEAFKKFLANMIGKQQGAIEIKDFSILPKYIRSRIENIKPEEFGFNGWGLL